jgi:hypothetical protein
MSVASVVKGIGAQIMPGGGTYGTYNNGLSAKPPAAIKAVSTPSYQPSTTRIDTSATDKAIADSNAAIKALQSQLAAQPKLPFYDTSSAWARAQKGAENAVNPVYTDKLNQYLEKARLKRTQTEEQTGINKAGINTGLQQTLEDVLTQRGRTEEDTATTLGDLSASEAFDQQQGGTQFDRARSALLGDVANAGLTTSGIGQQQDQQAITDRNALEAEQTRQYDKQQKAAETLKTRTFEDLGKSETRAKGEAETRTKQEDINLKNFIDTAGLEEKETRTQNEIERLNAVAGETDNQYQVGVADFIRGLIGSGARAQDIQLAQQIYG